MITITKDEYTFEVDLESTKAYYRSHSLCECDNCTYFYKRIKGMFPKLEDFLSEFGVDVSRPDEIFSAEAEDSVEYLNVDYTVCGNIKEMGQYEIDIRDQLFLSVVVSRGFACTNAQTGPYFTLSVVGIRIPGLPSKSTPSAEPESQERAKPSFGKIKHLFKKGK